MAKRSEIVLILSMLLLIGWSEGVNEFDYYQVVLQWQPATCSSSTLVDECVQPPDERFSIHGVWPSLLSGDAVCSGIPPYDGTQLNSSIRARLHQDWPSVVHRVDPPFWSHEWTLHGTCSYAYLDQFHYFDFGLFVYGNYDVLGILNYYNVYPNGNLYARSDVENIIYSATGKWPALRCNNNFWSGDVQLHEISLCFRKQDFGLEDCPYNAVKCNDYFVWNSWSSNAVKVSTE